MNTFRLSRVFAVLPLVLALYTPGFAATPAGPCLLIVGDTDVEYGKVTRGALAQTPRGDLTWGARTTSVVVSCTKPMRMSLTFRDLKGNGPHFAFGDQGNLRVRAERAMLDGRQVPLLLTPAQDTTRTRSGAVLPLQPDDKISPATEGAAAVGRQWTLFITVEPEISVKAAKDAGRNDMLGQLGLSLDVAP